MTIVGDLYSAHERAKIQGWLASVWALSAVLGPLAGGLIIQHFSWAWIFWMNLPIGALAAGGFWAYLHEKGVRGRGRIDHLSAGAFTVAIAAIMADLTALSTSDGVEISSHHRSGRRRGRVVCDSGAPVARADDLARTLGTEADRRGERRFASVGHGDDRAHDLSAGVRAGGDAEIAVDRRFRPLRDGAGMAGRGDDRRARLPAGSACAPVLARGGRAGAGGRAPFSCSSARTVRPSSPALDRSSSASGWASSAAPRSS